MWLAAARLAPLFAAWAAGYRHGRCSLAAWQPGWLPGWLAGWLAGWVVGWVGYYSCTRSSYEYSHLQLDQVPTVVLDLVLGLGT